MVSLPPSILTFVFSFFAYSMLRYLDQSSTKRLARRLDIQKHEINPLLTWLTRKWGLDKAFWITYFVFAVGIGLIDVTLNTLATFGFPAAAYLFGLLHVLAAANNLELDYDTRGLTKEQIESGTFQFVEELSGLSLKKSLGLLAEKYAFTVIASVLSFIAILSIALGDPVSKLVGRPYLGAVMFQMALVLLFSIPFFYSALMVGLLLWSRRLVRMYRKGQLPNPNSGLDRHIDLDVSVVEEALVVARANNTSTIRIEVD